MKLSLIAAIGQNNELGKDNQLIWHLPKDLKFFKEKTMNKTIIMGYQTYLSLPKKLPGRKYIVLSRHHPDLGEEVEVFSSKEEMMREIENRDEEMFVIGGASIYRQFIELCSTLYLTEIEKTAPADAYFPEFSKEDYEREVIDNEVEGNIAYKHLVYRRK